MLYYTLQRLLDTDLAIQVKAAEIELLGENLKSAHSEAEQLKHTLADTLAEKQKAEARLCMWLS